MERITKYDIALSFAGENREYADKVAKLLKDKGISVFYDLFEKANMWGKDLYQYLTDIYRNKALFSIIFMSEAYKKKLWTKNVELKAMQARAFEENKEYILPVRFDDVEIDGVLPTTGYLDLRGMDPEQLVSLIEKKLILTGRSIPSEYLRKAASGIIPIPKANPTEVIVNIVDNDTKTPIKGVSIVFSANNGTYLSGVTDDTGYCKIIIETKRLYDILIAHENYPSFIIDKFNLDSDLEIKLSKFPNAGSVIIQNTGYINGLQGRLNPILDSFKRMYLYADNIAINEGEPQPVTFALNEPIVVEDSRGVIMKLIFKYINGHTTALIDYIKSTYV